MDIRPTRKVGAGGIGGAVAVIVVWVVGLFGVDVPAEVAAAFASVGSFIGAWATSD